jgi:hypothetical protein
LRELHLKTSFGGAGAPGEDIEYELRPVDDFQAGRAFEVALLRGGEVVIDDEHIGTGGLAKFLKFRDFALSEEGGGVDFRPRLKRLSHNFGAGADREFGEFAERFRRTGGHTAAPPFESGENRFLRRVRERDRWF